MKVILKVVFEPYTLIDGLKVALTLTPGLKKPFSDGLEFEIRNIEVKLGTRADRPELSDPNLLDKITLFYDKGRMTEYYGKVNQIDSYESA